MPLESAYNPLNDPDGLFDIVSRRLFQASRERLFEAFTDPRQLAQWWGPKGFTNTFDEFDFRPGGMWRFTMHGANGVEYRNESRFLEIDPPEQIVLLHLLPMHEFRMSMRYGAEGQETELLWHMEFTEAMESDQLKRYIAEANEQNFDRLEALLQAD
ncbi:MAG: SRPBCC family protein [Candidatus Hydrogenedentes bacterium]|nr:SRPBCC family protein [Candidatus Hydrogenedentota bacterium]